MDVRGVMWASWSKRTLKSIIDHQEVVTYYTMFCKWFHEYIGGGSRKEYAPKISMLSDDHLWFAMIG